MTKEVYQVRPSGFCNKIQQGFFVCSNHTSDDSLVWETFSDADYASNGKEYLAEEVSINTLTLVLHKISSPEAYRAVYKALHGVFAGLSLVILSDIQEKRVQRLRCCYKSSAAVLGRNFMQHQG